MIDSRFGWVQNFMSEEACTQQSVPETGDSWEEAFGEERSSYHRNT